MSLLFYKNRVNIPSRKRTIHLRPGTRDHETFYEIFKTNMYGGALPFQPKVIIDAGANIGIASVYFKLRYREAKIAAIEIEKENIAMMRKNLLGDDFIIYENALFSKKAFFKVENPFNASNSFVIKEVGAEEKYDIESVTIDEVMKLNNWDQVDILKIDIEGAEKVLFESDYQRWLPKVKVLMIETHDRMFPDCSYTVMKAMKEFGFILFTTTEGTLIYYSPETLQQLNKLQGK